MSNLVVIFLSGLTVGGLTCLAVQGGLLAALVAGRAEEEIVEEVKQIGAAYAIILFLLAKLLIHTLLGFGLGFLGSALQLSLEVRIWMAILAGLFMIGTALRLLDIHPIFRYLAVSPPRFIFRVMRDRTRSRSYFAPIVLGLMTVLIPCGTTQAMEFLAVASGNPWSGAAIMAAFVLGTGPVFFTLGYLATKLGDVMHRHFLRAAAILVAILGFYSVNTGLTLAGHPFHLSLIEVDLPSSAHASGLGYSATQNGIVETTDGVQKVNIKVYPTSYQPGAVTVSHIMPIKVEMQTGPGYFCTNTVIFTGLGKTYTLAPSSVTEIDLGKQPVGRVDYICGSGMYPGSILVS